MEQTRVLQAPTLLVEDSILSFAFSFGFCLIWDFAGHCAGHVELVDVECGLTEGGHACIAVRRAAERSQVQGFTACDDGNVEGKFATAVRRGRLGDGEGRRGGELAAGTWRRGWLAVEEFVVLAACKEKLQRAGGYRTQGVGIKQKQDCKRSFFLNWVEKSPI